VRVVWAWSFMWPFGRSPLYMGGRDYDATIRALLEGVVSGGYQRVEFELENGQRVIARAKKEPES